MFSHLQLIHFQNLDVDEILQAKQKMSSCALKYVFVQRTQKAPDINLVEVSYHSQGE